MISKRNKGYTLLEVLLSVAIISIIAGLSVPVFQSFQNKNDLSVATENLSNALQRAQIFSAGIKNDDYWGVKVENSQIILFEGNNFANRDQNFDEVFKISSMISFSGDTELIFDKLTGEPASEAVFILNGLNGDSATVSVNKKGAINY